MKSAYEVLEVVEKAHSGVCSLQIVRAKRLGMEIYVVEERGVKQDDLVLTPFLSLFGARQGLQKRLRLRETQVV